ncbi:MULTISPECIES: fimbrial protein [Providencia]|uniref:fimbrial protein n=1 Tax=Providencia TaxID=586 RepID=UPI0018C834D8|nr:MULTISPECIES: fimbrial protein [Providencia]ELR5289859.1 type 1 fimbrial protein [Providencia rettgeri]MBG5930646.1 type 1 fimbrial protein [Providencia rettgeri]MBI6193050.1 type 1 fimbrial protein [Providencia rettgeri]MBS0858248.1 type 1 fimbrial protein [Providencia rettgeri]MBS0871987.1 type 1 fimbrial protein [Providencia rettgeri]
MNNLGLKIGIPLLLYSQFGVAEFRAEFTNQLVNSNKTLYVSRTLPVGTFIGSVDLGTHSPWVWWNVTGNTEVGIYLPNVSGNSRYISGVGYVREVNSSGVGYALHGTVMSPCSGSAYVDGVNTKDGNISNRLICGSNASSARYTVKLRADFYKVGNNVKNQTLPTTYAAMLILFNNSFIASDSYGRIEPKVTIGPINIISSGCEVKNKSIDVPFGKVSKSSFTGVGSTSSVSKRNFQIQLDCDPISPIKITFIGSQDTSQTPGAIALNSLTDENTAKGYAIQVKYNGAPIKLNQLMPIVEQNNVGQYNIPLEAAYIQTQSITTAGEANGTLQFNLQYH